MRAGVGGKMCGLRRNGGSERETTFNLGEVDISRFILPCKSVC